VLSTTFDNPAKFGHSGTHLSIEECKESIDCIDIHKRVLRFNESLARAITGLVMGGLREHAGIALCEGGVAVTAL